MTECEDVAVSVALERADLLGFSAVREVDSEADILQVSCVAVLKTDEKGVIGHLEGVAAYSCLKKAGVGDVLCCVNDAEVGECSDREDEDEQHPPIACQVLDGCLTLLLSLFHAPTRRALFFAPFFLLCPLLLFIFSFILRFLYCCLLHFFLSILPRNIYKCASCLVLRGVRLVERSQVRRSGARKKSSVQGEQKKAVLPEKSPARQKRGAHSQRAKTSKRSSPTEEIIDTYEYKSDDIPITITVRRVKGEFVPLYEVRVSSISKTTEFLLEKIRRELIQQVNLGVSEIIDAKKAPEIENLFEETIAVLIHKHFPDADEETAEFLTSYLVARSLGLGQIEFLMGDVQLEEIVINQADEPVWIYHKKHGWLKTNIFLKDEEQIKHYAALIGRKVGRQISVLEPLLDAHLEGGDRVNATLMPISTAGNTITIRKFSRDPWTITRLVKYGTISPEAAAWIWMGIHYEMSMIIAGGTASGKTSALNCFANFFPPNQRILSIEDTREIQLPRFLHWVPLNTRLPNAEGKGEISMEDLLVNSLRMRPDRIIVGEVRRKREAETLFEAIHTGHSVYATFHANTAEEAIERLTNPPIDVPKIMLPAISLIIVQFRNRRTGTRRTFQIAEILPGSEPNILLQYDSKKDKLVPVNKSKSFFQTLKLFTGMNERELQRELKEKEDIITYLTKHNILDVDAVGRIIAEYYTDKENLMRFVKTGKLFQGE